MKMILAGDIGGTKTELALFQDVEKRQMIKNQKFESKEYSNFEEIVNAFVPKDVRVRLACFGIAGPIQNNRCHATNLPWTIDAISLQKLLNIPFVFLINDLEANAWGVCHLKQEELYVLNEGSGEMKGNRALISAGTGLGEAGFYFDGKIHHPFPSEGGHAGFAPEDELEVELWRYLKEKFDHVSFERVLCGRGIANIYRFLVEVKKEPEQLSVKKRMEKEDLAKVISEERKNCPTCFKAIEKFISIYGGEAGNLALKFLALGGVYVGGGIAPKLLEALKEGGFMSSFTSKGRFSPLLSSIKVQVILNPQTALLGAAEYAQAKESGCHLRIKN